MWRPLVRFSLFVLFATLLAFGLAITSASSSYQALSASSSLDAEPQATRSIAPGIPSADCWAVIPGANPGPRTNILNDVTVISSNDAWAVGMYYSNQTHKYQTLTEHWDGATWTFVPSPNLSEHSSLEAVSAVSGNDVWAVGSYSNRNGLIQTMVLHWNGNDWSIVPSPNPGGTTNAHLYDVHAIAANDVWAVGDYYLSDQGHKTLAMHWDGATWSVVPTPNPGPTTGFRSIRLRGVTAVSSTDAWAVGDYYEDNVSKALTLHWDGAQWTHILSPNVGSRSNVLYAVDATSSGDVWAVGSYRNGWLQPFALRWDGGQWSVVPVPSLGEASSWLPGIAILSSSDVWAVGRYFRDGYWQPLTLHWNGSDWIQGSNPLSPRERSLYGIDAGPAGEVWAVGVAYSQGNLLTVTERLSGTCNPTATPIPTATPTRPPATPTVTPVCQPAWEIAPDRNPGTVTNVLNDVAAISVNDVWAVGSYRSTTISAEQTLTMHWDGTRWRIVPSPNPGAAQNFLKGVVAISSDNVWAVGYHSDGYGFPDQISIMHWDGNRWNLVPAPVVGTSYNRLHDIDALSATDIWAVGSYSNGESSQMLVLRWNGTEWHVVPTPDMEPSYAQLTSVAAISANDVWAINESSVTWVAHWDGTRWSIVDAPGGPVVTQFSDISATSGNAVWVVGSHRTLVENVFKYRTLVERWDGVQWRIVPSPNIGSDHNYLTAVDATSDSDVWAVGRATGSNQALIMRWDGSVWNIVPGPALESSSTELNAVAAVSPNNLWTVGSGRVGSSYPPLIAHYAERCPCSVQFTDVPQSHAFYQYIHCLSCRNVVSGYQCGGPGEACDPANNPYYRPQNNVTRGQLSKIIANAADFDDPIPSGQQSFEDVPPTSPFWLWIERLSRKGAISGYQCGGTGEPCGPANRPYFRPVNNATRGQISKIASSAANLQDPIPNTQQTFEDVPGTHPFWLWIERLSAQGVISGYQCGGAGEPCAPGNRPYFRPQNNTTRAQMAKIAANTFYPNCQTP